jgi:hypothetical protein
MGSLGQFGTVHEEVEPLDEEDPLTFDWFGEPIRLEERYNQVRLVNLLSRAHTIDERDPTAMVVVKDMAQLLIDRHDFIRFWTLAEQYDQTLQELVGTLEAVMAAMTDRPTQRPSDSSVGPTSSEENSPDDSPTLESRGRPDLQLLVDGGKESWARVATRAASG